MSGTGVVFANGQRRGRCYAQIGNVGRGSIGHRDDARRQRGFGRSHLFDGIRANDLRDRRAAGQDNWFGTAGSTGTVENSTVFAGSQAVEFTNNGGQNIDYQFVSTSGQGSLVQVTDKFYYSAVDSSLIWQGLTAFGTAGFLGDLVVYN
jgi:hypothetical protein